MKDNVYDESFYSNQKNGSLSSANEIVPILLSYFPETQSVIDFGCGIGTWLSVFEKNGVSNVLGLDGDYVPRNNLLIGADKFQATDLSHPIKLPKKFDIAISLEVAEHIPEHCADEFVESITSASDIIIFSAAIPGQGGDDHINEQWQTYWAQKFIKKGFILKSDLKNEIWNNEKVEFWYSQNINIYIKKTVEDKYSHLINKDDSNSLLNIVHPRQLELVLQRPPEADKLYLSQTIGLLFNVFKKYINTKLFK